MMELGVVILKTVEDSGLAVEVKISSQVDVLRRLKIEIDG
jgi:hypothetical protein